ncbi:SAM hydrolase/SAM-dependent halogenase family protein [Thiohalomonas denitrificans]|uniref:SAM hydrolase/SAM-dependent halogenase family protein n=1 Tax=Thiohalomonas denitrificans TaxID=415747 RepID=UPI0026E957AB|nr:SAM-dependent chlorinase/fluorinase [Thiohalomonas denitrificans]
MILMFTDFGWKGPYLGQMESVLRRDVPDIPIINLMSDAPAFNPKAAGYLLSALTAEAPAGAVILGVVDPGVGSSAREPVVLHADGRWFVGPGNGLFNAVAARADAAKWNRIQWQPPRLSVSFHGRDLFAPVAAGLASGHHVELEAFDGPDLAGWDGDLDEVVYIDGFGNAVTGIRADGLDRGSHLKAGPHTLRWARTFSDRPEGAAFWYGNSLGLVEIAANKANAAEQLSLDIGTKIETLGLRKR